MSFLSKLFGCKCEKDCDCSKKEDCCRKEEAPVEQAPVEVAPTQEEGNPQM